jgi:hypothetical protein
MVTILRLVSVIPTPLHDPVDGSLLLGTCLITLGRAHCKIATLQEAYELTFKDTFMSSCEKFALDIKDYEHQRKKLDSRR